MKNSRWSFANRIQGKKYDEAFSTHINLQLWSFFIISIVYEEFLLQKPTEKSAHWKMLWEKFEENSQLNPREPVRRKISSQFTFFMTHVYVVSLSKGNNFLVVRGLGKRWGKFIENFLRSRSVRNWNFREKFFLVTGKVKLQNLKLKNRFNQVTLT